MTTIIGINAFHADSSAVLIRDGVIIAAAEEERFRRKKHWAGFPSQTIKWCLKEGSIRLEDVDHISINTLPKANIIKKILYTLRNKPDPFFILDRLRNKKERSSLKEQFLHSFPNDVINSQIHFIEHHRAHMASTFYPSPFKNAAVVSVDGFGDFSSCAWGIGEDSNLVIDNQIYFPHSLGVLYTAITQFLGFLNYGDEYKVMGLAPYGKPKYMEEMKQIINLNNNGSFELNMDFFTHGSERINNQWSNDVPTLGIHFSEKLIDLLGKPRKNKEKVEQKHMDIAHSVQKIYEDSLFNLLNSVYDINPISKLCLSGGCANNSVANGKITSNTPFTEVFIQPAAGDAGGALGSALEVWHQIQSERMSPMKSAFLGNKAEQSDIEELLNSKSVIKQLEDNNCSILRVGGINNIEEVLFLKKIAEDITKGSVVGWFQDRMEWGPRALGNRSILGDPRRKDMKDILNSKVKLRESFRPFAPAILKEETDQWFELSNKFSQEVPYMTHVYPIKLEKRKLIPAVCHVDSTGRLQTVTEDINGRFYRLIKQFHELTGVPILLNTSFNENEPIVSSPKEALDCFFRTKIDILVLDNISIKRMKSE